MIFILIYLDFKILFWMLWEHRRPTRNASVQRGGTTRATFRQVTTPLLLLPSVRFSPPFFDFYPLLLLLLITISLYMWKKKRLNKQILFSTLIVCYAFFPSINEWDVFGVTQPPRAQMINGFRWLILFDYHVQDCPADTQDFRSEQCSRFNGVPFENRFYEYVILTRAYFFYSSIKSTDDDMLWILQMGPVHEGAQQVRAELHAERWEVLLPTQAQSHRRYSLWRTRRNWRLRCRPMFGEFYFFIPTHSRMTGWIKRLIMTSTACRLWLDAGLHG